MKNSKKKKGFTLIEMVIVLGIIAVLVAIVAPNAVGLINKSKIQADAATSRTIATAITQGVADGSITLAASTAKTQITTDAPTGIGTYFTSIPSLKANSTYKLYYSTDSNDQLIISAGADTSTDKVLYPNLDSTYK